MTLEHCHVALRDSKLVSLANVFDEGAFSTTMNTVWHSVLGRHGQLYLERVSKNR